MSMDLLSNDLTFDSRKLREALSLVGRCVPTRTPKPVLTNVLLKADMSGASLSATDLEVGVKVGLTGVTPTSPVRMLLPYARLNSILTRGHRVDTVHFLELDGRLTVRGVGWKFELNLEDAATYPEIPLPPDGLGCHRLQSKYLKDMIRTTIYATDTESNRYALGGALVEASASGGSASLALVATDGRRLARSSSPAGLTAGGLRSTGAVVIPVKALRLLDAVMPDAENVEASVGVLATGAPGASADSCAFAWCGESVVYTRLVAGKFPEYKQIIPHSSKSTFTFKAGELLDACRLASVTTGDESRGVDFDLKPGVLRLSASASEVGASEVDQEVAYDGGPVDWSLFPDYLTEMLASVPPASDVECLVNDGRSAVMFRLLPDRDFTYVVMPLTRDEKDRHAEAAREKAEREAAKAAQVAKPMEVKGKAAPEQADMVSEGVA